MLGRKIRIIHIQKLEVKRVSGFVEIKKFQAVWIVILGIIVLVTQYKIPAIAPKHGIAKTNPTIPISGLKTWASVKRKVTKKIDENAFVVVAFLVLKQPNK
jgi:hypothetical protein